MTYFRLRLLLPAASALLALLGTAACSSSSNSPPGSPHSTGATSHTTTHSTSATPAPGSSSGSSPKTAASIAIKNFAYTVSGPVHAGSTVKVTNQDSTAHTVTADSGGAFDVTVQPGRTETLTAPSKPGRYKFHCTFHSNMHGSLTVTG